MSRMLKMWAFELCFLTSLLHSFKPSHQLELKVHYQLVEDFGQDAEDEFRERHNIVRRDVGIGTNKSTSHLIQPSSSISQPKMSAMLSKSTSRTTHQTKVVHPYTNVTTVSSANTPISGIVASTSVKVSTNTPNSIVTMATTIATNEPNVTSKPSIAPSGKPNTSSGSLNTTPTPRMDKKTLPTLSRENDTEDYHDYYKSQHYYSGENFWFDLENSTGTLHSISKHLQYSDRISTSFQFPYYGHLIDYVTITNRGYVFLGETTHKFNASAQYVAPLMANFGPDSRDDKTAIRYLDTGERFTVEWSNMKLKNQKAPGEFSFQCSIFKNGTIIFAYKKIPIPVTELDTTQFFVRVGLSDTYRIDTYLRGIHMVNGIIYSGIHYITYYLYHKVKLPKNIVATGSAFVITPLPNCVIFKSCATCLNNTTMFSCAWCPKLERCSDGIDRHRQEWVSARCRKNSVKKCPKIKTSKGSIGSGEIFLIVLILVVILFVICWLYYGYRHPDSKLGMCLIQHGNPRKWCRKSGEGSSASSGGRISFKTMSFESNA